MKNKRLLFCAVDIGGRIEHYSDYIKTKYSNAIVKSFVKIKLPEKQYSAKYDYHYDYGKMNKLFQWMVSLKFFIKALFFFDIIYIISGENILTRKLLKFELWVYKLLNKKVIFHFVGGDIRSTDYLLWKDRNIEVEVADGLEPAYQTEYQVFLTKMAKEFGDKIIVTSPDLIRFFDEEDCVYVPVFLNQKKVNMANSIKTEKKNLLFHAPSNASIKGTRYIESVFEDVQVDWKLISTNSDEFREDLFPPYTVSKKTIFSLMNEAKLMVDQITIGWYGLQSIEALSFGCIPIFYVDPDLKKFLPDNAPIITFSDYKDLKSTILKEMESYQRKDQSMLNKWISLYHSIEKNKEINNIFDELFLIN